MVEAEGLLRNVRPLTLRHIQQHLRDKIVAVVDVAER